MVRETCKECQITLSEFEKSEYKDLCVECYREEHNQQKSKTTTVNVRLKNKRYFAHKIQNFIKEDTGFESMPSFVELMGVDC